MSLKVITAGNSFAPLQRQDTSHGDVMNPFYGPAHNVLFVQYNSPVTKNWNPKATFSYVL